MIERKKTMAFFLFIAALLFGAHSLGAADKRILIMPGVRAFRGSDSSFRSIYGATQIFPEAKVGFRFHDDYYVWGSWGGFKEKGKTQSLGIDSAEVTRSFLSFGLGFEERLLGPVGYHVEVGATRTHFSEEALELKEKGDKWGFRGEGGVKFDLSERFSLRISVGYTDCKVTRETGELRMGGMTGGATLVVRL
ncbi:MAG TPA: hypothetical protein PLB68_04170 [Candidatus Aminicenantes bacterium]|nr:hypothetical protein [Candidatus Aminicenantes bacterium]